MAWEGEMLDGNDSQSHRRPSWTNNIGMMNLNGPRMWSQRRADLWVKNRCVVLMILAQMISSFMAVAARELQTTQQGTQGMSESQVLISMMSITTVSSWIYMCFIGVAEAPLGPRKVWPLLTIRGIAGAVAIYGFYYSLRYLAISEAVVVNFLAPMLATFASDFIVRAHTSMLQLAAGVVSVCGVVLVSQPWHDTEITGGSVAHPNSRLTSSRMSGSMLSQNFTSHLGILAPNSISFHYTFATLDRIIAVGAALVGVAGGATAYVAMVFIGNRAHSVVTVYHFATWTVVMTGFGLLFTGTDNFRMPTLLEWVLLAFLGLSSLMLQTLVAASLQGEGSTVALNMTYTQIVFSLVMDKVVWDISPNRISLIGGGLILSSVIAVTAMEQGDIDPHTSHCESEMVDECHNACETELTLAQEEEGQEMVAR